MELTERKRRILKSIVDSYISMGEPIGSKYLSEHLPYVVSSATVRNEMSELEAMGYLEQPHSSAGRVPSTRGYRMYIEDLMERYMLTVEELDVLNELLNMKLTEFGRVLSEATRAISEITNYTTFSVIKSTADAIDRFEAVIIDDYSFLLVLICKGGSTKTQRIGLDRVNETELRYLIGALNGVLSGLSADQITLPIMLKLEEAAGPGAYLINPVLRVIHTMLERSEQESVKVEGITKLLTYPEFFDVGKARSVLEVFEQKRKLINYLTEAMPGKASILMSGDGSELLPPDSSFVFYPISLDGKTRGAIGVIGPKRMDYKKVIANLEYFVSHITGETDSPDEKSGE